MYSVSQNHTPAQSFGLYMEAAVAPRSLGVVGGKLEQEGRRHSRTESVPETPPTEVPAAVSGQQGRRVRCPNAEGRPEGRPSFVAWISVGYGVGSAPDQP
jgi:hypothetical protein